VRDFTDKFLLFFTKMSLMAVIAELVDLLEGKLPQLDPL